MPSLMAYALQPMLFAARVGLNSVKNYALARTISAASQGGYPLPKGASVTPVEAGGVPCEWLRPADHTSERTILYLHGGGFVLGWYAAHRAMVIRLAAEAGMQALAVDYRLAPEHPFPAALEDCLAAYHWLRERVPPEQIVIAGDSAGGNLVLTTLLALRDGGYPLPAAGVAISPVCDVTFPGESFHTVYDRVVSPAAVRRMIEAYRAGADSQHPHLSPAHADFSGLPPLLVHASEREILRDDAIATARRAADQGVDVTLTVWDDMWHVFHLFAPALPEARTALNEIAVFMRQIVGKP